MDEKIFEQGIRLALELGIRLKIELDGVDIPLESTFCGFVDNYIIASSAEFVGKKAFGFEI